MKFTKIRYAGGSVELKILEAVSKHDTDERTRKSTDQPRPEFQAAFKALARDVVEICELPKEWADQIEVYQVTIQRHPETERRSFVLTAKRSVQLANGPFVLHTPRIAEADIDDESGMSEVATERVDALIEEARQFLKGQRAQQEMFDDAEGASEEGETKEAAPDDGSGGADEWVPWACDVCSETRNYPRQNLPDGSATLCPKDCGPTMRPVEAAAAEAEPEGDPIRSEKLEDRPEFSGRRTVNALNGVGIYDVGQLVDRVEKNGGRAWLAQVKGLGQKGRDEVHLALDMVYEDLGARSNGTASAAEGDVGDGELVGINEGSADSSDDGLPY